ncbi:MULTISPECIES: MDR family oxidoreductase [Proteus]|jgi:acrylyl-CoA reductase (NADPH)|uniref:Putative zinc-binding dehydrogenase n=1 Tax=Proteus vulgaris TaxID=585 RepID=A0A379F7C0_PROVU|nr:MULTISPECIES: MDR family oxidoreductase [Proteus]NBN59494.1 acryloyl-CoA reductase [Proteus sp. G2639]RNT25946.1 oxidoreductase [Proteus mirabilis]KGA56300.1 putative quinone oxidoreductase YhdH [Proteus vulgaris]MBG5970645.1 oxidoreductase [Proteus vulgaris]MBG5984805.1 oxidoreductase [Proteus vulgaris]
MKALIVEQQDDKLNANVQDIDEKKLPIHEVIVDIHYSTLNYKDGLAITGKGKILRQLPMVPGIDFSGVVHHSEDPRFHIGQHVLLTGWGVGENHWGGLAQKAGVKGDWLTAVPEGLSLKNAMIIGTAGFTAMLCVMALEQGGVTPESGDILVTGASGGVGSTAISLLTALGYQVTALSGRASNHDYLRKLGAKNIITREEFEPAGRALDKQRWAGAIDTVGGQILANILSQTNYNGTVAACGLAGGFSLPTTVMPFILRNVRLQGVDSVYFPAEKRAQVWQRLLKLLPETFYQQAMTEIALDEVPRYAQMIMDNQVTGRTLVKL